MRANTKTGKLSGFSERTSDMILVVICAVVLFVVAYPLYYVLIASVSDPYDVYAGIPSAQSIYTGRIQGGICRATDIDRFAQQLQIYDNRYGLLRCGIVSDSLSSQRERSAGT